VSTKMKFDASALGSQNLFRNGEPTECYKWGGQN